VTESPGHGRVLGLDLGDVRIGVAISDPDRRLAVPLGTVQVGRPPGEMRAVADLVSEHDATLVVVGEPVSMAGDRGDRAVKAASFARALRAFLEVPVVLHDERWSTVEAERRLRDAGIGGRRRRSVIDAAAAQVILQAWLDAARGGVTLDGD
jgi:putative Holliday junction resolvase